MTTLSNNTDANPLRGYFSTSSIDDLTYVPPLDPRGTRACSRLASANTGRKSWKTLREKREAVWPPFVEAALFEALEKYRPRSSINTELLRRFPKRNRYISDYILKVTGKARTPKQVGSRLQQLRDTCSDKRVLALISRREFSPDPRSEGERCPSVFSNTSSRSSSQRSSFSFMQPAPSRIAMSPPFTDDIVQSRTTQRVSPPQRYVTIELCSSDPADPFQNQIRTPALRLGILERSWKGASPVSTSTPLSMLSSLTSPSNYSPVSPLLSPSSSSRPWASALPHSSHTPPSRHRLRITAPTPLWNHTPSVTFTPPRHLSPRTLPFFCVFLGDTISL
ncbi:hypothetical protein BD779DRAFT_1671833 [Infundibulicybe gibba]|nr:hypothetical protein BD779DRAFT_1671833 [Infundibulicybe gibba]